MTHGVLPAWGAMSAAERDAAYNNSLAVPGSDAAQRRRQEESARFRAAHPAGLDQPYGPHERQRIDIFGDAPRMLVFIHGGYWQRGGREMVSVIAEGPLAHGWSVAFPGYRLAPEATLDDIMADVTAALDWLTSRHGSLVVAGHSAGGQLAALASRHEAVVAGMAISGVFELGPVRDTFLNEKLRLSEQQIAGLSPLRLPVVEKPLVVAYGTAELPALIANSRDLHQHRAAAHAPGALVPVAGAEHFSVLEALRDPAGALCRALPA